MENTKKPLAPISTNIKWYVRFEGDDEEYLWKFGKIFNFGEHNKKYPRHQIESFRAEIDPIPKN